MRSTKLKVATGFTAAALVFGVSAPAALAQGEDESVNINAANDVADVSDAVNGNETLNGNAVLSGNDTEAANGNDVSADGNASGNESDSSEVQDGDSEGVLGLGIL